MTWKPLDIEVMSNFKYALKSLEQLPGAIYNFHAFARHYSGTDLLYEEAHHLLLKKDKGLHTDNQWSKH